MDIVQYLHFTKRSCNEVERVSLLIFLFPRSTFGDQEKTMDDIIKNELLSRGPTAPPNIPTDPDEVILAETLEAGLLTVIIFINRAMKLEIV